MVVSRLPSRFRRVGLKLGGNLLDMQEVITNKVSFKSLSLNPAFMKIIRRARAEVRRGEVSSLNQVKQEMLPETEEPDKPLRRTRRKASRG